MLEFRDLPRFACNLQKEPLVAGGFYAAKSNVDTTGFPLVGIVTGAASGIDALDIDVKGMGWLRANNDRLPQTRVQVTRSGGKHFFFRHAEGLGCTVGRVAAGVDTRGDKGYVIDWHRQGYATEDREIVGWPQWLLQLALTRHERNRAGKHAYHGEVLSGLDPRDYREHDDWFDVMVTAHKAGVDKDSFIAWSTGDEKYADDGDVIGRRWDTLRIGDWGRRVDVRAAELDNPKYYTPTHTHGPTCPAP